MSTPRTRSFTHDTPQQTTKQGNCGGKGVEGRGREVEGHLLFKEVSMNGICGVVVVVSACVWVVCWCVFVVVFVGVCLLCLLACAGVDVCLLACVFVVGVFVVGVFVGWCVCLLVCLFVGVFVCWCVFGVFVCWYVFVCWCVHLFERVFVGECLLSVCWVCV